MFQRLLFGSGNFCDVYEDDVYTSSKSILILWGKFLHDRSVLFIFTGDKSFSISAFFCGNSFLRNLCVL